MLKKRGDYKVRSSSVNAFCKVTCRDLGLWIHKYINKFI